MTPLEIDILLWYYTRAVDYRDGDFSAPAVRETIDAFRGRLNLIEPIPDRAPGDYRTYRLTERGQAYVNALTALPLPVCQWAIGPGFHVAEDALRFVSTDPCFPLLGSVTHDVVAAALGNAEPADAARQRAPTPDVELGPENDAPKA